MAVKIEGQNLSPTNTLGWRHVQCFLLFLGMASAYSLRVCMSVAAIAMRNTTGHPGIPQYDWDQTTYSTILGSFFWGYVITQIPAGHFARTTSALKILSVGILTSSIANMLIPWLAELGYVAVICGRIAIGLSQGCLTPCVHTLISRWVPPMERTTLGSFVVNGASIGTIMAMVMSAHLADSEFGWPSIFYFHGAVGIGWSFLFYIFATDYPSEHSKISFEEVEYIGKTLNSLCETEYKKLKVPWKSILTSVPLWATIIGDVGGLWGYYLFLTELPTYMKYILNYDISKSGTISALPYVAMWLMGFPISILSDYAIRKGATVGCVRKTVTTIALWIPALCLITLVNVSTIVDRSIVVGIFVTSIAFSSASTCSTHINHIDLSPNFASAVSSYMSTIGNLAGLGSPYVCGLVVTDAANAEQWKIIFYVTAGIYFSANLVYLIFGKGDVQPWNDPKNCIKSTTSNSSVVR